MSELTVWEPKSLALNVPESSDRNLAILPFGALLMGMFILAGRGTGKSILMAKIALWQFLAIGLPAILIDPSGSAINYVIQKLLQVPQPQRDEYAKRIVYVDLSGNAGQIVSQPFFYRLGDESLYQISQRFVDTLTTLDPELSSAPIQGKNSLVKLGTTISILLFACGAQITEAFDLLARPEAWERTIRHAIRKFPEVKEVYEFFLREYVQLPQKERTNRSESLTAKLVFLLDPTNQALFGASTPGISWGQVVEERKIVLLDFSKIESRELQRLQLLWWWKSVVDFIRMRGPGRHHIPLALVFDELSTLLRFDSEAGADVFAQELDFAVNNLSRNNRFVQIYGLQEGFQVPPKLLKTLLSMGTILWGSGTDVDSALKIVPTLFPYDPYFVKKREAVYGAALGGSVRRVDTRTEEFSIQEQQLLQAQRITLGQGKLQFFARIPTGEGDIHTPLRRISIANIDKNGDIQPERVQRAKAILAKHSGRPLAELLSEIEARREGLNLLHISSRQFGKMNNKPYAGKSTPIHPIPTSTPSLEESVPDDDSDKW